MIAKLEGRIEREEALRSEVTQLREGIINDK